MQKCNIYCGGVSVERKITVVVLLKHRFLAVRLQQELGNRLAEKAKTDVLPINPSWVQGSCEVREDKDYTDKYYISHPPSIKEDIIFEVLQEIEDEVAMAVEAERLRKLLKQ